MIFSTFIFTSLVFAASHVAGQDINSRGEFNWELHSRSASPNLTWVDCYTARQCAAFEVPLNYSDPSAGTATLALMRFPSTLPAGSADYRGPILFNPGGPGASGVDTMLQAGELFAQIFGPQFDIVSFDPRGVSRSTPKLSFILTEAEGALLNFGRGSAVTVNATSPEWEIPKQFAQAMVIGQLAHDRGQNLLDHMTTDNVARDMLSIVQASGFEKLQYWGVSYGTALGATFATMFPDKIERMVIDGVLDMESYYTNHWSNLVVDLEKGLQIFFDSCFTAGPTRCPFYDSSSDKINANLYALLDSVHNTPRPVYQVIGNTTTFGVFDYNRFKTVILHCLYSPYANFLPFAAGLADLAAGNATTIFTLSDGPPVDDETESEVSIACTDSANSPAIQSTVEAWSEYYEQTKNISRFSDVVVGMTIRCAGWLNHPQHFNGPVGGKTAVPLLVIGNTADPVTPLVAAKKTASTFTGAGVLTQNSPGHSSLGAASTCTYQYLRAYMVNATLPAAGTVCEVDSDQEFFPAQNTTTTTNTRRRDGKQMMRHALAPNHKRATRDHALTKAVRALSSMNIVRGPMRAGGSGF